MSWPTLECSRLIDAMVHAEGGPDAFVRAVRISAPLCSGYEDARDIAANTIAHLAWDLVMASEGRNEFVRTLGARWAPVGAANDPKNLNANWVGNVLAILAKPEGRA